MNAIRFTELNGPDSDPLKEPIDERAVVLAGHGSLHGRYQTFDKVIEHRVCLLHPDQVLLQFDLTRAASLIDYANILFC